MPFFLPLGQQFPQLFVVDEPAGSGQSRHLFVVQPQDAGLFCLLIGQQTGSCILSASSVFLPGAFWQTWPAGLLAASSLLPPRRRPPEERPPALFSSSGVISLFICHAAFLQYPFCLCIFLSPPAGVCGFAAAAAFRPLFVRCVCNPPAPGRRLAGDSGCWQMPVRWFISSGENSPASGARDTLCACLARACHSSGKARPSRGEENCASFSGRLCREEVLVQDQQPQNALLRPGGANIFVPQLPLLGLQLGRRVQVPPQLLPAAPGRARRRKARWTSSFMASGVILAVSAARVV